MHRCLKITVLGLALWTLLCSAAIGEILDGGYFLRDSHRLMLKLPPGSWQEVADAPASFASMVSGRRPTAILAAADQQALILVWVKHTYRDYSRRPVSAYIEVENFLEKRTKAARALQSYRYFEYDFIADGVARARCDAAAKAAAHDVRGLGELLLFFRDQDSYFFYVELLAESQVFNTVKGGFLEALRATYAY